MQRWGRATRDEYHLLIAVMALLSGVGQLVSGEVSEAMRVMPGLFPLIWAWTLIVSASLILFAAAVPDEDFGNWPELAGQLSLAFVTLAYAGGVLLFLRGEAPLGSLIVLAVSLAAFRRSWKVIRMIWPTAQGRRDRVVTEVQRLVAEEAAPLIDDEKRNGREDP